MKIRILLLSDIHGNYPALRAVDQHLDASSYNHIVNCGDSLVYAPFPNETLNWLARHKVISILGNTDKKVIKLLQGKSFKKPRKAEKRIMYLSTARELNRASKKYLLSLPKSTTLKIVTGGKNFKINLGLFHGSPTHHHEFLFANTPNSRFHELADHKKYQIIVTGHSHTPYHKFLSKVHFINPGSVGRMFDCDPRASCASLTISPEKIVIQHHRVTYKIDDVIQGLKVGKFPEIYSEMFLCGKKLN